MSLTIVCWKWKSQTYRHDFTAHHVNVWAASLRRNLKVDARLVCITDDPKDIEIETAPLWSDLGTMHNPAGKHWPSCYRRLKLFKGDTTRSLNIADGSRVAWIDLDVVFVKDVTPMFEKSDLFVGWQGEGAYHQKVYNGTMVMFTAGGLEYIWDDFKPSQSPKEASDARYYGSDQGWLSFKLAKQGLGGWTTRDGMFAYRNDLRPSRTGLLPPAARIVSFNGKWKPWDPDVSEKAPWIKQHWRL